MHMVHLTKFHLLFCRYSEFLATRRLVENLVELASLAGNEIKKNKKNIGNFLYSCSDDDLIVLEVWNFNRLTLSL